MAVKSHAPLLRPPRVVPADVCAAVQYTEACRVCRLCYVKLAEGWSCDGHAHAKGGFQNCCIIHKNKKLLRSSINHKNHFETIQKGLKDCMSPFETRRARQRCGATHRRRWPGKTPRQAVPCQRRCSGTGRPRARAWHGRRALPVGRRTWCRYHSRNIGRTPPRPLSTCSRARGVGPT